MGSNVTLIVQLAPAATALPQLLVWPKSPFIAMPEMFKGRSPELLNTTGCAELVVPTF